MADYAPPSGPPPPHVPEGWKAVWNDQYKEWFYVNTFTKASQWDKPTQPAPGSTGGAPAGPPPGYNHNAAVTPTPEKSAYGAGSANVSEDEKLARRLQEEENARSGGSSADRGASDSYYTPGGQGATPYGQPAYGQQQPTPQATSYGSPSPSPYGEQQQLPPRDEKSKGLFGKLAGKFGGGSSGGRPAQYGQQYGQGGGYPQQQNYPPQQYGGYPQQGGGYYPQQQQQQPQKQGMGAGGALLGAGAGLVGGALLMDAFEDHSQNEYNQG